MEQEVQKREWTAKDEATEFAFERQLSLQCGWWLGEKSRQLFAKLAHFRESANLRFKGLIVLALDLKFRLEFFHEQVQMGNLDAKLLDVGRCRSSPDRSRVGLLRIVVWLQRLSWSEGFRKGSWPGRFGRGRSWWGRRDRPMGRGNLRR